MAQQGACTICGEPYQVICPKHLSVEDQAHNGCPLEHCSPEKHIKIPCGCDPDLWEVNELLNPDATCCAVGVCPAHLECERHGHCPDPHRPKKEEEREDEDERCPFQYVGQCASFFMGPNGERARCATDLDGVADSVTCPDCVKRFYPRLLCDRGCGQARRWFYDYASGAWMRVCPCDDKSSEEGEGERKKQKTE
jgi:hypothetical protein